MAGLSAMSVGLWLIPQNIAMIVGFVRSIEDAFTVAAQLPAGAGDALAAAARAAFVSGVHVAGGVAAVTFALLALVAVRTLRAPAPDPPTA